MTGALVTSVVTVVFDLLPFRLDFLWVFLVVFVLEPSAAIFESVDFVSDDIVEEVVAVGAAIGLSAGFVAAVWAKRPVGRATATPSARMRAMFLFISILLSSTAQKAPAV